MPDVAQAATEYFTAGRPTGPDTAPPPVLALPLRDRLALLDGEASR